MQRVDAKMENVRARERLFGNAERMMFDFDASQKRDPF